MFTHFIKRPQKPGLLDRIFRPHIEPPHIHRDPPALPAPRPLQQAQNLRGELFQTDNPMIPAEQREVASKFMDKAYYNDWVEQARRLWPKGSYCTLRMFPMLQNRAAPPPWFVVDDHQEIRHLCQWDHNHREPRAIGLRSAQGGPYMFVSPAAIRPLTHTERELIAHLQDQQKQTPVAHPASEEDDEGGTHGHYAG